MPQLGKSVAISEQWFQTREHILSYMDTFQKTTARIDFSIFNFSGSPRGIWVTK